MAKRNPTRESAIVELLNQSLDDSDLELSDDEEDEWEPPPHEPRSGGAATRSSSPDTLSDEDYNEETRSDAPSFASASSFIKPNRARTTVRGARLRSRRVQGRSQTRSRLSDVVGDSWTATFQPQEILFYQPKYKKICTDGWTHKDYFEQYIDDQIIQEMVTASNRTYVLQKGKSLGLTVKELKVFIGVTMVMAATNLPQISMYWSRDYGVMIIKENMARNRYFTIRSSLKVVFDDDVTESDKQRKIWKVYPLFTRVLSGCKSQEKPLNMSIDEMIIPFTGQCGIRQYCPGKPNPVGIKIFVLATPEGIVCDMIVYQLDKTFPTEIRDQFNLGESAIIALLDTLAPGHNLFFDRYFTTTKLLDSLLEKGYHGTGTMQKNRIPRDCILSPEKDFVKKERGSIEVKCRADGQVAITRWLDNKPVIIGSTLYSDHEVDLCERWSKRLKQYEMIPRPECVKYYNCNMGGVDMADRMLSVCPSRARTRKWTIRFISHMIDLAVSNSWLQFRMDQKSAGVRKIPQLRAFKMQLGKQLISSSSLSSESESDDPTYEPLLPQHKKRKTSINPVPSEEQRFHKAKHLIDYDDKQHRCRRCTKLTTAFCVDCKIFLCSIKQRNCHLMFHSKTNSRN